MGDSSRVRIRLGQVGRAVVGCRGWGIERAEQQQQPHEQLAAAAASFVRRPRRVVLFGEGTSMYMY